MLSVGSTERRPAAAGFTWDGGFDLTNRCRAVIDRSSPKTGELHFLFCKLFKRSFLFLIRRLCSLKTPCAGRCGAVGGRHHVHRAVAGSRWSGTCPGIADVASGWMHAGGG